SSADPCPFPPGCPGLRGRPACDRSGACSPARQKMPESEATTTPAFALLLTSCARTGRRIPLIVIGGRVCRLDGPAISNELLQTGDELGEWEIWVITQSHQKALRHQEGGIMQNLAQRSFWSP